VRSEKRLRLELIRKYGPKSEKLNHAQLHLPELEPGVSAAEFEAEGRRVPLSTGVARNGEEPEERQSSGTTGLAGESSQRGTRCSSTPEPRVFTSFGKDTVVNGCERSE
jgi:hypothetical protein